MKLVLCAVGLSVALGLGGCGAAVQEPSSAPHPGSGEQGAQGVSARAESAVAPSHAASVSAAPPRAPGNGAPNSSQDARAAPSKSEPSAPSKSEPKPNEAASPPAIAQLFDLLPPQNATKAERLAWAERLRLWTAAHPPAPASAKPEEPKLPKLEDHRSALERQLAAGWGWRGDRDGQVRVPLVDWRNWKRVRLGQIDHLTAFKYTKDHHLVTGVFTVKTPGERPTSQSCIHRFDERAAFELGRRGVKVGQVLERSIGWQKDRVLVRQTEGTARLFFTRYDFSAAWAAYPAYEDGCLVYATVVLWEDEPELARRVLERWITEGLGQTRTETARVPARKED